MDLSNVSTIHLCTCTWILLVISHETHRYRHPVTNVISQQNICLSYSLLETFIANSKYTGSI